VQDQEKFFFQGEHKTLAKAPETNHLPAVSLFERRAHRAQEKWAGQTCAFESRAEDSGLEGLSVDL
jgi:hypothetical protein